MGWLSSIGAPWERGTRERGAGGPAWHLLMQAQPSAYSWPQLLSEAAQDTSFLSCGEPGLSLCCSGAGSIGQALPMPLLCTQVTHREAKSWHVSNQLAV